MSAALSVPVAILSGGVASRMRPLTDATPKAMLPVAGEPFIAHQLRMLARQGFDQVVLCVGYLGKRIEAYVGNGEPFGLQVRYSYESEDRLLWTGGALRHALSQLGDVFFILYGDSYLTAPLRPAAERFLASDAAGMMTVYHNTDRWDASNVLFRDGRIVGYSKERRSAEMRHIDYGFGGLRRAALDGYPEDVRLDLSEVFRALLARGQLLGCEVFQRFYEIGSPAGLAETEQYLTSHRGQA